MLIKTGLKTLLVAMVFSVCSHTGHADTIGYWRFEEGVAGMHPTESGTANVGVTDGIIDSSGLGHHGTAFQVTSDLTYSSLSSGSIIDPGGVPNTLSMSFPGDHSSASVERIQIADHEDFDTNLSALTFEALVNPNNERGNDPLNGHNYIATKWVSGGTSYILRLEDVGTELKLKFFLGGSSIISDVTIPLDQWTHVAATWEGGATGAMKLYINGVEDTSGSATGSFVGSVPDSTTPLLLGANGTGSKHAFNGNLDEIRFSNEALAPGNFLQAVFAPEPSFIIDRLTGSITLENPAAAGVALNILGYSITSSIGALNTNAANWKSIANNYDNGSPGPDQIDSDDPWTILSTQQEGHTDLSEYQFLGTTSDGAIIESGGSVQLSQGNGVWIPTPNESDLIARITLGDGSEVTIPIVYTGNGDAALQRSDFDHSGGDITELDWIVFKGNNQTDLSGLSLAQQQVRGDLDGDGDNDVYDFQIFKADFEADNGPGSFALMVQGVPEPSSIAMLCIALFGFSSFKRLGSRTLGTLAVVLVAGVLTQSQAEAAVLDHTAFTAEGLVLHDDAAWTTTSGTASLNTSNARSNVFYSSSNVLNKRIYGTINPGTDDDFFGLVLGFNPNDSSNLAADYLLLDWKKVTQNNNFGDPDGNDINSLTPDSEEALLGLALSQVSGTPSEIEYWSHQDLAANTAGGVVELARGATFGSTGYATNFQNKFAIEYTATNIKVTINGQKEFNMDGTFTEGRIGFFVNGQATPVVFSDFDVYDLDETLTAIVNRVTGDITLKNNTADSIVLDYYQLESAMNSLDFSHWTSLEASGAVSDGWEVVGGSSSSILAEGFYDGVTTLAPGNQMVLVDAYDTNEDKMDIEFTFNSTSTGHVFSGLVEYVTGATEDADFNGDGDVDGSDFLAWQRGFGSGTTLAQGDANDDGNVNATDLGIWVNQYGVAATSSNLTGTSVPEPSTLLLLAFAALSCTVGIRKNRC